jgi:hypothetical protein
LLVVIDIVKRLVTRTAYLTIGDRFVELLVSDISLSQPQPISLAGSPAAREKTGAISTQDGDVIRDGYG